MVLAAHCKHVLFLVNFFANVFSDPPPSPATTENPERGGRWNRRVVPRSSPELKSGASRPSLSIRCTGKRVVSRALSHDHRLELVHRRETIYAKDTWWTDLPSCWCFCTLRHAQVQRAQQSVPCLVFLASKLCTLCGLARPPSPPFLLRMLILQFLLVPLFVRWNRRVVPRSSPELKSGASRPSLSIRCTGKRVVSRALSHDHRLELVHRRETIYAKDTWWTDLPSCTFFTLITFSCLFYTFFILYLFLYLFKILFKILFKSFLYPLYIFYPFLYLFLFVKLLFLKHFLTFFKPTFYTFFLILKKYCDTFF